MEEREEIVQELKAALKERKGRLSLLRGKLRKGRRERTETEKKLSSLYVKRTL